MCRDATFPGSSNKTFPHTLGKYIKTFIIIIRSNFFLCVQTLIFHIFMISKISNIIDNVNTVAIPPSKHELVSSSEGETAVSVDRLRRRGSGL